MLLLWTVSTQATVSIPWVTVGNPGNAADPTTGVGSVDYSYQISKYEVTNTQYAEFLNAKAAVDSLVLYNPGVANDPVQGIARSGSPGSYTYAIRNGYANKPVVYVNWYQAIRFANWLSNGQGNGDTESGAYTLTGGTPIPGSAGDFERNPNATIVLPSDNEWYKAAYYDPTKNGTGGYWRYGTRSDVAPTSEPQPGGSSSANYFGTAFVGGPAVVTDVGAYVNSRSFYGAFDETGNVSEWTEGEFIFTSARFARGGAFNNTSNLVGSDSYAFEDPGGLQDNTIGFRVASIVPEPTALGLITIAAAGFLPRRRFRTV